MDGFTTGASDTPGAEAPPPKIQLTPADWITAATHVLVDQSIDAVRVDVLAKLLKVTRGSFYWHFKDRNDLLARILTRWRDAATERVIQRFEDSGDKPANLVRDLLSLPSRGRVARDTATIELAIRAWARRDEMARQAVDMVDAKRLGYIQQCFVHLGCAEVEAQSRAFTVYGYIIGESLLSAQGTEAQRLAWRHFIERTVLAGI
ncbi:MAG: TetR/AcrR family transcriptional regulator [Burkholderiaceae bacterium]|nr:TetR/AcrR family transcriptional regulator [Burkholderiaceae bacterium]